MSWNILAPELLQVFWRSSYGLPLLDARAYDDVTAERFRVIVEYVRACAPDVLLLQEVTDTAFACLGGRTTASFIAQETGLTLATASYKGSRFSYGTPPNEQPGRRGTETMDSGVTTLYKTSTVRHVASLGRAEDGGPCALFPAGVGSPFAVDAFLPLGGDSDSPPLLVVNVHVRMQFPRIAAPLEDVVARVRTALSRGGPSGSFNRVLLGGDLNAGGAESCKDLQALLSPGGALGRAGLVAVGAGGAPCDDHFLAGRELRVHEVPRPEPPLPVLAMGVGSASVSDTRLWSAPDTLYTRSEANAERLGLTARSAGCTAGSDHPPLLISAE
jgi:endonuclease/exonuclease/phosphatase family metal-dependent hydrolase